MGKSRMPNCNPQIRMVAGFVEVLERKEILVAGVRFELFDDSSAPESRGLCGTPRKTSARLLRAHDRSWRTKRRPGACARPANLQLVAGACNHPNLLVLPFSLLLIRAAA
jgi:hypothetical protein